jgi:hypothetical protein
MGLGHLGLTKLALKFKKNPERMDPTELLLFLNTSLDKLKIMGGNGKVIGYLKLPNGRKINLQALQYIPQAFGVNGFDYDAALEMAVQSQLDKRGQKMHNNQIYTE